MNGEVVKHTPVKNKDSGQYIAAVLLCFFLGGWSAHRIFLKKWSSAIPQLVCKFLTIILLIVAIVFTCNGHTIITEDGRELYEFATWPWIVWVLSFIAYHIWVFVDFIILCCGKFKDNNGNYVCYQ